MSRSSSLRVRLPMRSIAAALGFIAAVGAIAVPAAETKTRLREVVIAPGGSGGTGYPEYKVIRGSDGVFRGSDSLRVPLRVSGKLNNSGNGTMIFNAYFLGYTSGKPLFPVPGMTPSRAYKLLRSPTKNIATGTFMASIRKPTLGNFSAAAEKRCKERRSGDLLPLRLAMVVDAGRHATMHPANTYQADRVRKVVGTTIHVRVKCHASHGPKTSTDTRGSGARPPVR